MIKLIARIIILIYNWLLTGEPIDNIKSACYVEYANYLYDICRNWEKAIIFYNRALSFNSNNSYAYGGLAAIHFEKKQFKKSLEYCKSAYAINAGITVQILMQVIYEVLGESNLAKEQLQNILKFYENDLVAAYDWLAYAYLKVDMLNAAEHFCEEALKNKPNAAILHYNMGIIYFAKNEFLKSKTEFAKVLELANDRDEKDRRSKQYAIKKIRRIDNLLQKAEKEKG
ncbi:MAG TPA: hypothetical protein VK654_12980 [Nitrospirota bacterium]|nr:hypothetical protein [Nitrospirota bacterium]